jgi:hypothetical protein
VGRFHPVRQDQTLNTRRQNTIPEVRQLETFAGDGQIEARVKEEAIALCKKFPIYG